MRKTVAGLCEQLPGKSRVENGIGDHVRDARLPPLTGQTTCGLPFERAEAAGTRSV